MPSAFTPPAASVTPTNTVALTNKRITRRIGTTTSSATPTINTDNYDEYSITALSTAITSLTTNLSGTPDDGDELWIRIKDDGTPRAITHGASFSDFIVTLPTTTVSGKWLVTAYKWVASVGKWCCMASGSQA